MAANPQSTLDYIESLFDEFLVRLSRGAERAITLIAGKQIKSTEVQITKIPEEQNVPSTPRPLVSGNIPSVEPREVSEVTERREIFIPADTSSLRNVILSETKDLVSSLNQQSRDEFSKNINDLRSSISNLSSRTDGNVRMITLTQKIDSLSNVTLSNATFSGVAGLTDADIPNAITVTGSQTLTSLTLDSTTATSTIATGGFAVGTSQFVVQQTSGNVGIGTAGPTQKLTVGDGTSAFFANFNTLNTDTYIGESQNTRFGYAAGATALIMEVDTIPLSVGTFGSADFTLGTNNTARMIITTSGNVGIGTTSPTGLLSVEMGTQEFPFWVGDQGTSTPAFVVRGSGNVGIGTTSPNQLLSLFSATTPSLEFSSASGPTNKWTMGIDTADANKFKIASSTAVGTNARLTIDGNGNVGIGTSSPMSALSVVGNIAVTGCAKAATSSATGYAIFNTCADYAETYEVAEDSLPGDIMMVGEAGTLRKATNSSRLLGIISSDPGSVLEGPFASFGGSNYNSNSTYEEGKRAPLALMGRVPVKVSTEGGPITPGDRITLSSIPGVGMKATSSSYTVGIALEFFNGTNEDSKILVFVNLGYSKLDDAVTSGSTGSPLTNAWSVSQQSGKVNVNFFGDLNLNGNAILNVQKIIGMDGKWKIDEQGNLVAQKVTTQELEVGSAEKPDGVTLYDEDTKEPYCLKIKGGAVISITGKCGRITSPPPIESSPEPAPSSNPEPTPEPPPALEPAPNIATTTIATSTAP